MKLFQKYWMDLVGGISTLAVLAYGWYTYGWQQFVIWSMFAVIGGMAVYWFGDMMPVVGYFLRKWDREKRDGPKGRQ